MIYNVKSDFKEGLCCTCYLQLAPIWQEGQFFLKLGEAQPYNGTLTICAFIYQPMRFFGLCVYGAVHFSSLKINEHASPRNKHAPVPPRC